MPKTFTKNVKSFTKIWHKLIPYRYCIEFFIITIIFCLLIDFIARNPSKWIWSWDRYSYLYLVIFLIVFTIIIERLYFCCQGRAINTIFSVIAITFSILSIAILINLITKLTTVFGIESNIIGIIQTLLIIIPGLLAIIAGEGVLTKTGKGVIDGIIKFVNIPQDRRYVTYLLFSMSSFIISFWSLYIIPQNLKYFFMKRGDEAYCLNESSKCKPQLYSAEDAYLKMIKIDPSNLIRRLPNKVDFCYSSKQANKGEDNGDNVTLDNNNAYYHLGEIYRELREFEKSRRYYKIAYKSGCNQALDGIALSYLTEKGDKEFSLAADTFRKATERYENLSSYTLTESQYKILFALVENYLYNEERKSYSEAEKWLKLAERAKFNTLSQAQLWCPYQKMSHWQFLLLQFKKLDYLLSFLLKQPKVQVFSTRVQYLQYLKLKLKALPNPELKLSDYVNSLYFDSYPDFKSYVSDLENCYKINLYYSRLKQSQNFKNKEDFKYLRNAIVINALFWQLYENFETIKINKNNYEQKEELRKTIHRLANEKRAYKIRENVIENWLGKQENVNEPDVNNSESLKDIDLAIDTIVRFVEQQIPNTSDKK
jgi:hypothetical protein